MPQGKQAKMLTPKQETAVLTYLQTLRYPFRDRVMFLLSIKAGLRAKEIACLTWSMVTDADGQIAEVLALPNTASKGRDGSAGPDVGEECVGIERVLGCHTPPCLSIGSVEPVLRPAF